MHGAVKVVANILFAGPRELHRLACGGHGHLDGLGDKVNLQTPSEAAAQQGDVNRHFVWAHACGLGRCGTCRRRDLRWRPNLYCAVFDLRGAVHGLHGGVGQIGCGVTRLNDLGRRLFGGVGVALVKEGKAAFAVQLALQFSGNGLCVQCALGALLPLRHHSLGTLAGVPGGLAYHGKTGAGAMQSVQGHYLLHAGQGQRSLAVK